MALPKAELSLEETRVQLTFDIPCPCGLNSLVTGNFVLGVRDYRAKFKPKDCSHCEREDCTVTVDVLNSGIQKLIKFEYDYAELSSPEYWAKHAAMQGSCMAKLGDERIMLPRIMPDTAIIKSTTFSCWWENRLGMLPTLSFQQNLP